MDALKLQLLESYLNKTLAQCAAIKDELNKALLIEAYKAKSDYKKDLGYKRIQQIKEAREAASHITRLAEYKRRIYKRGTKPKNLKWPEMKLRYNHTCPKCGRKEPDIQLTRDHIVPLSMGGTNIPSNIQPLCRGCNATKGNETTRYEPYKLQPMPWEQELELKE